MLRPRTSFFILLVSLLYLLGVPSFVAAQMTFRLQQEAFVFTVPALFDPGIQQFVKETCARNTDIMHPLVRVPTGESITILTLYSCPADSGNPRSNFPYAYAKIKTEQGIVGYMLTTTNMRAAATAYLAQIQPSGYNPQTKDSSNLNPGLIQNAKLPEPSTPTQPTVSSQQTAQSPPAKQNTILLYLIGIFVIVGIIWYAINTPALAINKGQRIIIIGTTAIAVLFAFYGYQAIGGAYIAITVGIAAIPWGLLFGGWQNPVYYRQRDESFDFVRVLLGIIPPLILLYIFSRELSTQASYCIVFTMSSLLFWCLFVLHANALGAEAAAEADTEKKRNFIKDFVSYSAPLSRLLSQYHPDWYPPPVSDRLKTAIGTYATFLRNLARAKGETPSTAPDEELIRSLFTERSFPDSWDYETTIRFCNPIFDIVGALQLCAGLTLEEQTQYEAELTAIFDSKTKDEALNAEDRLPPELLKKINHVVEVPDVSTDIEQEIEEIKKRLTALIPAYIAQTYTVIGTAPNDDFPMIYRQDERFQHTYIIGKTGSGKSTLLRNLITQDIHHGYGVIVLSPENGLFQDLLPHIPESRKNDLIYFDPTDIQPPIIGFNPLTLEQGEDLEAKAGETMTIFKRALGDLGVTMEPLIRNAVYALLPCPNSTITDIYHLIDPEDPTLRRKIANTATVDDLTRKFWIDYNKPTLSR